MSLRTLPVKQPAERVPLTWDFSADMPSDDSLVSCTVAVEAVVAGTDATPATLLDGLPAVAGRAAVQWVRNGVNGATYRLLATAATTQGRTLQLRALLPVRIVT